MNRHTGDVCLRILSHSMRKVQSVFLILDGQAQARRCSELFALCQTVVITIVLSSSYHRLLILPDMQRKTQRWHCVRR